MIQLSVFFKENPSVIGSGAALVGALLHNQFAEVSEEHPNQKFVVTNAFVSLSAMLAMVARTVGTNLDWKTRAVYVGCVGISTMIPAIYHKARASANGEN